MLSRIKWKFVKNLYSLLKIQILLKMLMFPMPLMLRSGSVSLIFHFCASRTVLRLCSSPHATPSLPSIYFLHLFKRTSWTCFTVIENILITFAVNLFVQDMPQLLLQIPLLCLLDPQETYPSELLPAIPTPPVSCWALLMGIPG